MFAQHFTLTQSPFARHDSKPTYHEWLRAKGWPADRKIERKKVTA